MRNANGEFGDAGSSAPCRPTAALNRDALPNFVSASLAVFLFKETECVRPSVPGSLLSSFKGASGSPKVGCDDIAGPHLPVPGTGAEPPPRRHASQDHR
jgi:hypothetical protein